MRSTCEGGIYLKFYSLWNHIKLSNDPALRRVFQWPAIDLWHGKHTPPSSNPAANQAESLDPVDLSTGISNFSIKCFSSCIWIRWVAWLVRGWVLSYSTDYIMAAVSAGWPRWVPKTTLDRRKGASKYHECLFNARRLPLGGKVFIPRQCIFCSGTMTSSDFHGWFKFRCLCVLLCLIKLCSVHVFRKLQEKVPLEQSAILINYLVMTSSHQYLILPVEPSSLIDYKPSIQRARSVIFFRFMVISLRIAWF